MLILISISKITYFINDYFFIHDCKSVYLEKHIHYIIYLKKYFTPLNHLRVTYLINT